MTKEYIKYIDVIQEIQVHAVVGSTEETKKQKGWVHTHGMAKFGKPELEMRNIPEFMVPFAVELINNTCDYILNSGETVLAGEIIQMENSQFKLHEASSIDPDNEELTKTHYQDTKRWVFEEVEHTCSECGKVSFDVVAARA